MKFAVFPLAIFLLSLGFDASGCVFQNQIPPQKLCNDSAAYFLEIGQEKLSEGWIDKALKTEKKENSETSRSYLLLGDLNDSKGYVLKALDAYRKSDKTARDGSIKAMAKTGVANSLVILGQYDSVEYYITQSLLLDSGLRNRTLNEIALARSWQSQNISEKSIHYWQLANEHAQKLNDKKLRALSLAGMASASFSQDPGMKRVREYLRQSNVLCDSSKHANIIGRNYTRMANAYMVLGNISEAERYLRRAKIIVDISENPPLRSYVLSSYAILKSEQGDIDAAVAFSEEPIRIKREQGQLRQLQNDLLNISEWYIELRKFNRAKETLREGISTSKALGDVVYLQYFYDRTSRVDSLTGDYRAAFSNLKRSMFYKDSAQSLKRFRAVEEVREKYEAEQKEIVIAEKEIIIQRQRWQQLTIVAGAMIAILVLILILIILRSSHRKKIQKEKDQQHQLRLQTIVHTQEEVQQSIARDIHDGLVQVLGAAKMSLESVSNESDRGVLISRITEASKIMDEACTEARNISHQILPYCLLKGGLEPALDELLSKSFSNFRFIRNDAAIRLKEDIEINVYRIAQELVNNIIKHAEAGFVKVDLKIDANLLTLIFEDDGKGFDLSKNKDGVGMTNIQTRSELIGGRVAISSEVGKGTTVTLTVPL